MTKLFTVVAATLLLAGCALTPDQLKALGESKSGMTACFWVKAPGYETMTVVTNGRASAGAQEVVANCATRNVQGQGSE